MHGRGLGRGVAFVVLAAYWAGVTLAAQFSIDPPGLVYDVWYSAAPGLVGVALSVGVGLYIGRWWAVLAALVPVAVLAVLVLAGHVAPWHDAGLPLTGHPLEFVVLTVFWFYVLPIALGVLVRRGLGRRGAPVEI